MSFDKAAWRLQYKAKRKANSAAENARNHAAQRRPIKYAASLDAENNGASLYKFIPSEGLDPSQEAMMREEFPDQF